MKQKNTFSISDLLGEGPRSVNLAKARPVHPQAFDPAQAAGTDVVDVEAKVHRGPGSSLATRSQLTVVSESQREAGDGGMFSSDKLEAILLDMGVSPSHAQIALKRYEETHEPLAQIMRDMGFLSGEQVAVAVARQTGLDYFGVELAANVSEQHMEGLSLPEFRRFVPVGRSPNGELMVAVPDPSVVNDARNFFQKEKRGTHIVVASEHTIQSVFRKFFAKTAKALDEAIAKYTENAKNRLRNEEDESSVGLIRTVYFALLRHACYSGASDLYLFRSEYRGIVRLKINGVGHIDRTLDLSLYTRLLNKMVQDNTKPEELAKRPMESVVEFSDDDKAKYHDLATRFGFRLELAQSRGENSAVIRILDKNSSATDLARLPFDERTRKALTRVSKTATGFFLVTGPTGSGKTTSLYALLKAIDPVERSIQSIEDPIEYKHGLWIQFELRKAVENKAEAYEEWLKALLRNAPDVILIGEVRDRTVAGICMDAANTGHLVFATLHTNSAVSALGRLKALHIDPNLLGSSLLGILAQRLVQVLCPACSLPDERTETLETLNEASYLANVRKTPRLAGRGCAHCDLTGFKGRRMVYELLEMPRAVRIAIEEGQPPSKIAEIGLPEDRTMWACGLGLVAEGITSLDELQRVANKNG